MVGVNVESLNCRDDFIFCLFLTSSASGMDILNGAIDSLVGSSSREDWTPVALNVADATVTISKDKVRHTSVTAELLTLTSSASLHSVLSCFL